jgi:uncharacterized protein (TIGR02466 family)
VSRRWGYSKSVSAAPQIEHIFATPVIVDRLANAAELNAQLEPLILEKRQGDPGIRRSNVGGWHSDTGLLSWGGAAAQALAARVVEIADAHTIDRLAPEGRHPWQIEAWANVGEAGAANAPHSHPGCYWSAVYYVRTDEGEGGELILFDPRMPGLAMQAPDLRFRNAGGEQLVKSKPSAGMLVMFPSWLMHSVTAWHGSGLRISVAINLSAVVRPREGLVDASSLSGYQPARPLS